MPTRSATAIGHVSDSARDDMDRIDGHLERCSQTPSPCWHYATVCRLPGTAIVELQSRQHRLRCLQQVALDAQITKGTEVRAHRVARIEEGPEMALQLRGQFAIGRFRRDVVTSDQQPEVVGELLDRIANILKSLLANGVIARPIGRSSSAF